MMKFTELELRLMRLLWEHGEMKPPEIARLCHPAMKDSALRGILSALVEKGHVVRRREGRAYYYKPTTAQENAFHSMLRNLVDTFCGGSAKNLMFNMVEQEQITADDLAQVQALVKASKQKSKRGQSISRHALACG